MTWIFGYGSIIWRPDFPHVERRLGWVDNHTRRFWQGSPDHRGTPDALGRVCTLVPTEGERCWGVAYRLPEEDEAEIMAYLDHRERGGYVQIEVEFVTAPKTVARTLAGVARPSSAGPTTPGAKGEETRRGASEATGANADEVPDHPAAIKCVTYIASPSNPYFLGPAPLHELVAQIASARGESGKNSDYVISLAEHLRESGIGNEHVTELAAAVKAEVEAQAANGLANPLSPTVVPKAFVRGEHATQ